MNDKLICKNCKGNGYIKIEDEFGGDEIRQCWICESEGEIDLSGKDKGKGERIYDT